MTGWIGRWFLGAAALAVLVLFALWPAFRGPGSASNAATEDSTITDYVADFTVARNGDLRAVETLTVNLPSGHHGIYRFWDTHDPSAAHARRIPEQVSVTYDGTPATTVLSWERDRRYRVARIGDAGVEVPAGRHTYVIRYTIPGVVEAGTTGQRSQFYWNLVPGGWLMPIRRSALTVHLPVDGVAPRCAEGSGATTGCAVAGGGTRTLTVRTGALAPDTPVTVKTGLDLPTPAEGHHVPWTARWDPVLGTNPALALVVLLAALAAGAAGLWLSWSTRERQPGFPLMYAPPEAIGPAQGAYLLDETVGKRQFVASLMQASEKGATRLDHAGGAWTVRSTGDQQSWRRLDPVTGFVGSALLDGQGSFTADRADVAAGKQLAATVAAFGEETAGWARTNGLMVRSGLGGAGRVLVPVAFLIGIAAIHFGFLGLRISGWVPGFFAVGAAALLAVGAGTRRTPAGRELWSRVGGFHRILSTPSAEERFDFSGRTELYTAYLPWAVAFGCADTWAQKFRTETGSEPPVPAYFIGGYGYGGGFESMVDDFSATVDGAISSYQATQHSSSGGGGGFSGGGGGGGGGGGSW